MAGELGAVRVRNLATVQRALARTEAGMRRELRGELKSIGEPIRSDAQSLALATIRNVGIPWARMRVGLSVDTVFVVPVSKSRGAGKGAKRPNLANLLMDKALEPALARNHDRIADDVDAALGRVVARFGSYR